MDNKKYPSHQIKPTVHVYINNQALNMTMCFKVKIIIDQNIQNTDAPAFTTAVSTRKRCEHMLL